MLWWQPDSRGTIVLRQHGLLNQRVPMLLREQHRARLWSMLIQLIRSKYRALNFASNQRKKLPGAHLIPLFVNSLLRSVLPKLT